MKRSRCLNSDGTHPAKRHRRHARVYTPATPETPGQDAGSRTGLYAIVRVRTRPPVSPRRLALDNKTTGQLSPTDGLRNTVSCRTAGTATNEATILYLLALGSPTHAIGSGSYAAYTSSYTFKSIYGLEYLHRCRPGISRPTRDRWCS